MHFPLLSRTVRPDHCDPLFLFKELGLRHPYCALLESATRQGDNDYSFVAIGAHDVITVRNGQVSGSRYVPDGPVDDPLCVFAPMMDFLTEGERLHMGYIGFLSYEAARHFEDIALEPNPDIPDALFVLPEILLKIDHVKREVTIVAHKDAEGKLADVERVIHASPFRDDKRREEDSSQNALMLPTFEEIEPYRRTSQDDFCAAVKTIQTGTAAGETFQTVLSQELCMPQSVSAIDAYEQLRTMNPSPYMYCFQTPDLTIVGASPETLVRIEGREIRYHPIAGTRERTGDQEKNRRMQEELLNDEKERCEHQMLVDLGRNDVGRVAEIGSVRVENPFHIEAFAHVYHIVSDIVARIRPGLTALDVVRSVFPAGTLTGAPKVRAMGVIRDIERSPRGIYGGAFGYIDLCGNVDFAIMIRTMLFQAGEISLRVGAGIVKDSVPILEDRECLHKARSCLAAITLAKQFSPSQK